MTKGTSMHTHPRLRHVQSVLDKFERLVAALDTDADGHLVVVPPKKGVTEFERLRRRLLDAVQRDLSGDVEVDGRPRRSGPSEAGGRGGGAVVFDVDEAGDKVAVPVTGVESAAFARAEGLSPADQVHELVLAAVTYVESAAAGLSSALKRLELLDVVTGKVDVDQRAGRGRCLVCTRMVQPSDDKPEDRLKRGLCPTDYQAWVRADRPELSEFIRMRKIEEAS